MMNHSCRACTHSAAIWFAHYRGQLMSRELVLLAQQISCFSDVLFGVKLNVLEWWAALHIRFLSEYVRNWSVYVVVIFSIEMYNIRLRVFIHSTCAVLCATAFLCCNGSNISSHPIVSLKHFITKSPSNSIRYVQIAFLWVGVAYYALNTNINVKISVDIFMFQHILLLAFFKI